MNRGGCKGVEGLRNKHNDYIKLLNGHWTFLWGNHDKNNSVKPIAHFMFCEIGQYRAFVSHYPIENLHMFDKRLITYVSQCTDFQICGHIHNAWKTKYFGDYLMYNVGIDAHRYNPVDDSQIVGDISSLFSKETKK